ncbi:MAG: HEAT repeat domain-containing protein [Acidimicrobiia bacterium]|nr:HEAT repeat domain-containing protein [Acidimicrobiia bacterium]
MSDEATEVAAAVGLVEYRAVQYEQVRAVFDTAGSGSADTALAERIRAEFPRPSDDLRSAVAAFRDLLRIEQRHERFRRLLRAWSAKVTAGIRSGDFATAGIWMKAVTENPVFPGEYALHVTEAIRELSRPALLDELVVALAKAGDPPGAAALLSGWGEPLVEYLIGGMLVEEPRVNRRHLVEYLAMAGRNDVRLLTPWLRDPRWFIVRNVATAVGKTGRESALPALLAVTGHEDDRVRIEAVRAVATIEGAAAVPLLMRSVQDPSQRVRHAAVSLLRAEPSDDVVVQVGEYLAEGSATPDDARRLVKIIVERSSDAARQVLASLADKRFAVGSSKVVRDAARKALGMPT